MLTPADIYRALFERLRGRGFGLGLFDWVHKTVWEGFLQPEWVEVNGCLLHLPRHDEAIGDCLRMGRVYEPEMVAAFQGLVRPGMTVLDIGANIGYYSVLASRLVGPAGSVLAFEPAVENLGLLLKNIAANRCVNVIVHPYAVGRSSGYADLSLCLSNPGAHSLAPAGPGEWAQKKRRVVTVGLDEFLPPEFKPDLVKMDIEGGELSALRGMPRILAQERLKTLFIACNGPILTRMGLEVEDVLSFLRQQGFATRFLDQTNVLCTR